MNRLSSNVADIIVLDIFADIATNEAPGHAGRPRRKQRTRSRKGYR